MQPDVIAVFPLPNVVFFPQTNLPLHIFEPRYRKMVEDTLENKQMIGMFLLQPGWEDDYYGNPPIFSVGCAGELIKVENLPEGKFNILLRGVARVRALETVQEAPYRRVRVHVLAEQLSASASAVQTLKRTLIADFKLYAAQARIVDSEFSKNTEFAEIVNGIASALQLDIDEKRNLLEMDDTYDRGIAVKEHLSAALAVLRLTSRFNHLRPEDPNVN